MKSPKESNNYLHSPNHITNHVTQTTKPNKSRSPWSQLNNFTSEDPRSTSWKIPRKAKNNPCFFWNGWMFGETPIFHIDNDLVSSSNWKPFILKILLMDDILHRLRLVVYNYTTIYRFSTCQVVGNGIAEASTVGCYFFHPGSPFWKPIISSWNSKPPVFLMLVSIFG